MPRRVEPLARVMCASCVARLAHLSDGELARAVATPTEVPASLRATHSMCRSCLTVHAAIQDHAARCALKIAGVALSSVGWSSGISMALREDLRRARPSGFSIACRLMTMAAQHAIAQAGATHTDIVVLSVPTGGRVVTDPISRLATEVAKVLGARYLRGAIKRDKRESTRSGVAEARARIAGTEYSMAVEAVPAIERKTVVLLDDTATTGHTLAGLSRILLASGASLILPVTLDRSTSPRLLQRAEYRVADQCPHVAGDKATRAPAAPRRQIRRL
jgi:adenine/guanine phosphoribosyltransferase-like PRPP-binding protein